MSKSNPEQESRKALVIRRSRGQQSMAEQESKKIAFIDHELPRRTNFPEGITLDDAKKILQPDTVSTIMIVIPGLSTIVTEELTDNDPFGGDGVEFGKFLLDECEKGNEIAKTLKTVYAKHFPDQMREMEEEKKATDKATDLSLVYRGGSNLLHELTLEQANLYLTSGLSAIDGRHPAPLATVIEGDDEQTFIEFILNKSQQVGEEQSAAKIVEKATNLFDQSIIAHFDKKDKVPTGKSSWSSFFRLGGLASICSRSAGS